MTLRLTLNRFTLLLAALALAALAACGPESAPQQATPTAVGAAPTATAPALPASPPTVSTDQVPQPQLTGGPGQVPQPQLTGPAGQVPPAQPTGGAGQVPQPQVTGSPALVTPGAVDPDEPPRISLQELQQLLTQPDTLLVDVRTAASYQERHINGAVSIPFPTLEQHIQDVPRDKFIVAYCQ